MVLEFLILIDPCVFSSSREQWYTSVGPSGQALLEALLTNIDTGILLWFFHQLR